MSAPRTVAHCYATPLEGRPELLRQLALTGRTERKTSGIGIFAGAGTSLGIGAIGFTRGGELADVGAVFLGLGAALGAYGAYNYWLSSTDQELLFEQFCGEPHALSIDTLKLKYDPLLHQLAKSQSNQRLGVRIGGAAISALGAAVVVTALLREGDEAVAGSFIGVGLVFGGLGVTLNSFNDTPTERLVRLWFSEPVEGVGAPTTPSVSVFPTRGGAGIVVSGRM